jgi:hypothetical protein
VHLAIFGQPEGHDGGQYGKAREDKRDDNVKTYVEARTFHEKIILVPKILLGGIRQESLKVYML